MIKAGCRARASGVEKVSLGCSRAESWPKVLSVKCVCVCLYIYNNICNYIYIYMYILHMYTKNICVYANILL